MGSIHDKNAKKSRDTATLSKYFLFILAVLPGWAESDRPTAIWPDKHSGQLRRYLRQVYSIPQNWAHSSNFASIWHRFKD